MLSDYRELLSILNAHRVKYPVVGAYAVAIDAQPRATKNLDILVKADTENAQAVFAALADFGAPMQGLTPADFEEPGPFFRIGREPVARRVEAGVDTQRRPGKTGRLSHRLPIR